MATVVTPKQWEQLRETRLQKEAQNTIGAINGGITLCTNLPYAYDCTAITSALRDLIRRELISAGWVATFKGNWLEVDRPKRFAPVTAEEAQEFLTNDERALFAKDMMKPLLELARWRHFAEANKLRLPPIDDGSGDGSGDQDLDEDK